MTPPATNTDGCDNAMAIGASAASPHIHRARSGVRHQSKAAANRASAASRSDAYGLTSAACRIG